MQGESPCRGKSIGLVSEPNCVAVRRGGEQGEENWWPVVLKETNVIRPDDQASWRRKTKPESVAAQAVTVGVEDE
jgi:hypothetical protein